jgi:hypothetical protein
VESQTELVNPQHPPHDFGHLDLHAISHDHNGPLGLGTTVNEGNAQVVNEEAVSTDRHGQPQHEDVLPYPTMTESLIGQEQPYDGLQNSYQTSGQTYPLDMQMYNAEEAANAYVGAAAEQIYQAMDPYATLQRQDGE